MSWVTVYGVAALTFMMVMYWLEHRGPRFILGFALGCLLSSVYGFLAGAWPFGVLEAVWCLIALRRYAAMRPGRRRVPARGMLNRGAERPTGRWSLSGMLGTVSTRTLSGTAIVVVVTLGLAACSGGLEASTEGSGWTRLTPQALDDLLRSEDVYLVNVHVPYEGEIVGTDALIPFTDLAGRMAELPAEGGPTLVLYCRSGNMSSEAAQDLVDAGRTGFFELEGGFNAWVDAGLPFDDAPDR